MNRPVSHNTPILRMGASLRNVKAAHCMPVWQSVMYRDRVPLYQRLEEQRGSKVVVYVTGDRRGLETVIASEVLDFFLDHLDTIQQSDLISLYLYTRGGDTLAAWSLVHLIRQFCNRFEVIVPFKSHSAGTLICLGANNIVMTKQATLGPIDPSVNTPLNPEVPGTTNRWPVSVEAISGYLELARENGVVKSADWANVLKVLTEYVHPLVLGQAFRTRSQIRMLGQRLLSHQYEDATQIENILAFLCSESGSHAYTIYRQEARNLGLTVETPTPELYETIWSIYESVARELHLTEPFDPKVVLGENDAGDYVAARALIESAEGGSHVFVTEGSLTRQRIRHPQTGMTQEAIQTTKTSEGWRHENV